MEFGHEAAAVSSGDDAEEDDNYDGSDRYDATFGAHFVSEGFFDAQASHCTTDDACTTPPACVATDPTIPTTLVAHVNLRFGVRSAAEIAEYCGVEGVRAAEGLKARVLQRLNAKAKQAVARVHTSSMAEYIITLNTALSVYRLPAVVDDQGTPTLGPLCAEKDLVFQRPLAALMDARLQDLGRRDTVTFRYVSSDPGYAGRCTESSDDGYGALGLSRKQTLDDVSLSAATFGAASKAYSTVSNAPAVGSGAFTAASHDANGTSPLGDDAALSASQTMRASSSNFQSHRRLRLYDPPQTRFGSIGVILHFQPFADATASSQSSSHQQHLQFQKHNFLDVRFQTSAIRDVWWNVFYTTIGAQLLKSVREGPEHESQRQPSLVQDRSQGSGSTASIGGTARSLSVVDVTRRPSVDKFVAYFRSDIADHAEVEAGGEVRVADPMLPPDGGVLNVVFSPMMTKPRRVWLEDLRTRGPDGVTAAPDAGPDSVEPHLVIGPCNMRQRLRMVPSHAFPLRTLTVSAEDDQWGNAFYLERHDAVSVERSMLHLSRRLVQQESTPPDGGTPTDRGNGGTPVQPNASFVGAVGTAGTTAGSGHAGAMAPAFLRVQLLTKSFVVRLKWMQWFQRVLGKPTRYVHDSTIADEHQAADANPWDAASMLADERRGVTDGGDVPQQRAHAGSMGRLFSWSCAQPLVQRSVRRVEAPPHRDVVVALPGAIGAPQVTHIAAAAAAGLEEGADEGEAPVEEGPVAMLGQHTDTVDTVTVPSSVPIDPTPSNERSFGHSTAIGRPPPQTASSGGAQTEPPVTSAHLGDQAQPPAGQGDTQLLKSDVRGTDSGRRLSDPAPISVGGQSRAARAMTMCSGPSQGGRRGLTTDPVQRRQRKAPTTIAPSTDGERGGVNPPRQRAATITTLSPLQPAAVKPSSPDTKPHATGHEAPGKTDLPVEEEAPLLVAFAPCVWLRKPSLYTQSFRDDDGTGLHIAHWHSCRLCILQIPSAPPYPIAMFDDAALAATFLKYGCVVGVDLCLCVDWLVRVRMVTKPMAGVLDSAYASSPGSSSNAEDWAWVQAALEDPVGLCLRETCVLELFVEPSSTSMGLALDQYLRSTVDDSAVKAPCRKVAAQDAVCAACAFQCPLELHVVGDAYGGGMQGGAMVDLGDAGPAMAVVEALLPFLP